MANYIIDSLNIPGTSDSATLSTPYGTCSTEAANAAKVVDCANFLALAEGAKITVKFSKINSVSNPTLNVNNTGAQTITCHGVALTGTNVNFWRANEVITFTYDGTNWCIDGMRCPDDFADILARNDAMIYKGTINGSTNTGDVSMVPATADAGWTYKVATAGYIGSKYCQVGDMLVCNTDTTSGQATVSSSDKTLTYWDILQTNVDITDTITDTDAKVPTAGAVVNYAATKQHTHSIISSDSGHTHTFSADLTEGIAAAAAGAHTHTVTPTGTVESTDAGHTHEFSASLAEGSAAEAGSHTHEVTAQGDVEITEPTDSEGIAGHTHTAESSFEGTAAAQDFEGTTVTSSKPSELTTVASQEHTHSYTPAGTVQSHNHSITSDKTNVGSVTNTGTLPSHDNATLSMSASNKHLTVTFNGGDFSAGTLPTVESVSVVNSINANTGNTAPTFNGTFATIAETTVEGISVASANHTHTVKAEGKNKPSTATGKVTTTVDKATTGITATFKGTTVASEAAGAHTHEVTGTVSSTTESGKASITSNFKGEQKITSEAAAHTHTVSGYVSGTSDSSTANITSTVTDNGHTHSYSGSTGNPA